MDRTAEMIEGVTGGSLAGWSAMLALCAYRRIRCRVCGGADCAGALDRFGLCNQAQFGRGRRPEGDRPEGDQGGLLPAEGLPPGQVLLSFLGAR